ncbi:hypothetical protein [Parafannyhessea umbonata]
MLIGSLIGVDRRTTTDLDTTVTASRLRMRRRPKCSGGSVPLTPMTT